MIAAIMQPTYLPWAGYFDLVDQADVFVFLDTVQFSRQSWQQRNRIKGPNGAFWLTVPVFNAFGQRIDDVRIDEHSRWRMRHWSSIRSSYGRARFFTQVAPLLDGAFSRPWNRLVDLNIHLVCEMAAAMGIGHRIVRASTLGASGAKRGELLVEICRSIGAETYMSPPGSRIYLEAESHFRDADIRLLFHSYEHPAWPQRFGPFTEFLSAVDLIMNVGYNGAADVIRSGRRTAVPATRRVVDVSQEHS
jgi:hypothetical protein